MKSRTRRFKTDHPTYAADIVGTIGQWDERDILFARSDFWDYFDADSPQRAAYYESHPELFAYDEKVNNLPPMGRTGGIDFPMFDVQFDVINHIGCENVVDGKPAPDRIEIAPERAAEKVKGFAHHLGADLVGIGPLRQEWVYSHVGRSLGNREGYTEWGTPIDLSHHPNAIALGFRMDYDLTQTAPDFPTLLATGKGYATGAWVSVQLAAYIRALGYSARAHHLRNYRVLCVPVAVDCGLGELSRAGFLITKELGLGLRLAVVTTDLPLIHDQPVDIGVQSFCEVCKVCAEVCPIGAIPHGDKAEYNGVKKWKLDEQKCYRYWFAAGTDCGTCMAACPWTKPDTAFHRTIATLASIKGLHQSILTRADRLVYGKYKSKPRPGYMESK
ncbi:MAG: reductive dehalogenase [Anaerolineae bacterium]|nr:reductive dehalogenase [Anaerolineae bacterium]